ncbi:MAG: nucleotidyltransferase [Planctomycetes bacterium]|nr:nucleotidyltransferase [Planctomycetota bacterium]
MIQLPPDFSEFLKLLNSRDVRYLLVGGYAVSFYGTPRATGDIDVWIDRTPDNADKIVRVLEDFGFDVPGLSPELFTKENNVVRLGTPPLRIELLTSISGVEFDECHRARSVVQLGDIEVSFIGVEQLKINKRASGRPKDLADLESL